MNEETCRAWLHSLRAAWRNQYASASTMEQEHARHGFLRFGAPARVHLLYRMAGRVDVPAARLVILPSSTDEDAVTIFADDGLVGGDALPDRHFVETLEAMYERATAGWTPDRVVESQVITAWTLEGKLWAAAGEGPPAGAVMNIRGALDERLIGRLVADAFRIVTGAQRRTTAAPVDHAYFREDREPELVRRVARSSVDGTQLLSFLGVAEQPGPPDPSRVLVGAWRGEFLLRKDVFGEASLTGDVDFLVGPLYAAMTPQAFAERVEHWRRTLPMGMRPSNAEGFAAHEAFETGRVLWPPDTRFVVAGETKVSRFGPNDESELWQWHGKKVNEDINSELEVLWARGVAYCSAVHLGVTAPTDNHFRAGAIAGEAARSFETMRVDTTRFGHLRRVIGAVSVDVEDAASASPPWQVLATPVLNPNWLISRTRALRERLGRLPAPRSPWNIVVRQCSVRGAWCLRGKCAACDAK